MNIQNETEQVVSTRRLDLLEKIWNRVKPEDKKNQYISSIMQVTHNALNASASSLLMLDKNDQELVFQFADGPVGQQLKRLQINKQSGIAGWIMSNGKPLIVNDAEKNSHFYKRIDKATGFKTKSIIGVPLTVNGRIIGVIEVLNKQDGTRFDRRDLQIVTKIASTTALGLEKIKMNTNLINAYKGTVKALVSLADAKETSGGGHSRRVADYALMATSGLTLSKENKEIIEYAAILHDIGKLSIPDSILNKADEPSNEEWEIIHRHPMIGWELLKNIPFLEEASALILHHHERYDGTGYPQGLMGDEIPLGARLIAVADAFDHMTTKHAYRAALSRKDAFTELQECANSQFCPKAVKAFKSNFIKSRLSFM